MSSFEFNKILAAIILAIIVIVIFSKVGDIIVDNNKEDLQVKSFIKQAYQKSRLTEQEITNITTQRYFIVSESRYKRLKK